MRSAVALGVLAAIAVACGSDTTGSQQIDSTATLAESVTVESAPSPTETPMTSALPQAETTPPTNPTLARGGDSADSMDLSDVVPVDVLAVGDGVVVPTDPIPQREYATWVPIASDGGPWFYVVSWTYSSMGLPVEDGQSVLPDGTVIGSDWFMTVQGLPAGDSPLLSVDNNYVQLWQVDNYAVSAALPDQCVPPDAVESWAREGSIIVSKDDAVLASIGLLPAVGGCRLGESMTTEQFVGLLASLAICDAQGGEVKCEPLPSPTKDDIASAITFLNQHAAID